MRPLSLAAAAEAISLAVRHDNLPDAFHILNTSNLSRRLPAHVLLHTLIRHGFTKEASRLSEQMTRARIPPRSRSLNALFTSLAQTPSTTTTTTPVAPSTRSQLQSLTIQPSLVASSPTRSALRLLLLARQSRQRRTHRMFKALLTLCLINGEIILASLLFGVLVRDWQSRVQLAEQQPSKDDDDDDLPPEENPTTHKRSTKIYDTPFPAWSHLNNMCGYIAQAVSARPPSPHLDPAAHTRYADSIQALANLAHLLDQRILPIGGLTGLLQPMYKSPTADLKVWVWERKRKKKEKHEVDAQGYFKQVLNRLAAHLPKRHPNSSSSSSCPRESAPAPLTLQTYNTLLHYSLAHAQSRRMADKILHHMVLEHDGLSPSATTMNILVRAAARSRSRSRSGGGGITTEWVKGWERKMGHAGNKCGDPVSELRAIAARYAKNSGATLESVNDDNYALSTRIAALVSRGRPEAVVGALPALLPGVTRRWRRRRRRRQCDGQDPAVRRALVYGPVVLTSILNAVMKTGRTGLAEKVWEVMKAAEGLSWVVAPVEGSMLSPWSLGVEAYTVMIQVYGKEARKGAGYGDGSECGKLVVGWGRLVGRRRGRQRAGRRLKTRVHVGRFMGMKMYREGLRAGSVARLRFDEHCAGLEEGVRIWVVKRQLGMGEPDAKFFNAILDVVVRKPGMTRRSRRSLTRRRARTRLIVKRRKYAWEGRSMRGGVPDGRLREVVRDMGRYGIQVPLLVKRILIGWDMEMDGIESGQEGRIWAI